MNVLKNALVLDAALKQAVARNIYFEGNTITKVTPAEEAIPEGVEVLDAAGRYVTCGLIDAHTHLAMKGDSQGFEGIDHNEKNDPVTPQMRAIDGINPQDVTVKEALEAGVTVAATGPGSANVVGGTFACIHTYGTRIDNMIIKYPMAMKIAFGENPKKNYNSKNKTPITRMGIAALLRELLQKTIAYKNNPNHAFDAKLEAMLPVIEHKIPLKAHAHRGDDMLTAIRIAKEFGLDMTLDHCTGIMEVLDDVCSEPYPLLMGPSLGHRSKIELKNKSFTAVAETSKRRDVCIITDAPVIPLEYLPVCVGLAIEKGMDYWKGLEAVTINPAKAIGIADRYGSLEPGKEADIVVWKKKPFVHITSPAMVIAGGVVRA